MAPGGSGRGVEREESRGPEMARGWAGAGRQGADGPDDGSKK